MNVYSFALNPNDHQPLGGCNLSRLNESSLIITDSQGVTWSESNNNNTCRDKNSMYFHYVGEKIKRQYVNDWNELKEYIGYDDIILEDNILIIYDYSESIKKVRVYATNYNVLRVRSGMAGIAYSN